MIHTDSDEGCEHGGAWADESGGEAAGYRRVPQQSRSRDRVERILEVTNELVLAEGVETITTRSIAAAAGIPVASFYQYFTDKDQVLVALVNRYLADRDRLLAANLAAVEELTVRTLVRATMHAMVDTYRMHPALVMIFLRGRAVPAIRDFTRDYNLALAQQLFERARGVGMTLEDATGLHAELAIEICDRLFQIAFDRASGGDEQIIEEAITMVTAYLETHSTEGGPDGPTT